MTKPPPRYAIGIDTGGTYSDAAVIDLARREVVASAKALTTRGDLAAGITEALAAVLAGTGDAAATAAAARYVSLSTTLATNALVEGHGSPIGVVLIGFDAAMAERSGLAAGLEGARVLRVAGGHDHAGAAVAHLDEAAVTAFIEATRGDVAAYAVAGTWSVRNPTHEQRVRDLVTALSGLPTTLSSELAHALDAPRRALTAALNARIIGRISALIAAVREGMARHGIAAPLLIVKGDGTLAPAEDVALRPIETILSGPAASTIGAKFLSGLSDLVVADIGGTTTDIAVLEGGWPKLDRSGARVGGHRTMVQAIDMHTHGLGGDSEVGFDEAGRLELRANRIWPLALLGSRWPDVIAIMREALDDPQGQPHAGRFALRLPGEARGLSEREAEVLARIGATPTPLGRFLRGPLARRALERLASRGLVALGGFTPSDAGHVLGRQGQWSREAAFYGALLLQRASRMLGGGDLETQARAVAQEVFDAVVAKSGRVLLASLADTSLEGAAPLIEAAVSGSGRLGSLRVAVAPRWPVVAVGGPAPVFYPELGARLGCEVVLPPHGEVCNAVGAAVAVMRARATADVTSLGLGGYRVHHDGEPIAVGGASEALALAQELAVSAARAAALASGVAEPVAEVRVERIDLPGSSGDLGLISASVVAECVAPAATDGYAPSP